VRHGPGAGASAFETRFPFKFPISEGLRFTIFVFNPPEPPRAAAGPVLTPGSLETPSGHLLGKKKRHFLSGPT
jgi:hypothetical protein